MECASTQFANTHTQSHIYMPQTRSELRKHQHTRIYRYWIAARHSIGQYLRHTLRQHHQQLRHCHYIYSRIYVLCSVICDSYRMLLLPLAACCSGTQRRNCTMYSIIYMKTITYSVFVIRWIRISVCLFSDGCCCRCCCCCCWWLCLSVRIQYDTMDGVYIYYVYLIHVKMVWWLPCRMQNAWSMRHW